MAEIAGDGEEQGREPVAGGGLGECGLGGGAVAFAGIGRGKVGKHPDAILADSGAIGFKVAGGEASEKGGAAETVEEAGGSVVEGGELPKEKGHILGGDGAIAGAHEGGLKAVEHEQILGGHLADLFAGHGEGGVEKGFAAAGGGGSQARCDHGGKLGLPNLVEGVGGHRKKRKPRRRAPAGGGT